MNSHIIRHSFDLGWRRQQRRDIHRFIKPKLQHMYGGAAHIIRAVFRQKKSHYLLSMGLDLYTSKLRNECCFHHRAEDHKNWVQTHKAGSCDNYVCRVERYFSFYTFPRYLNPKVYPEHVTNEPNSHFSHRDNRSSSIKSLVDRAPPLGGRGR